MQKVNVLLVEDSPKDARLISEALKETKVKTDIQIIGDGDDAINFLRQEGEYSEAVRPDIILLDLDLPSKDGREVLCEIKSDKDLRCIPVLVLSDSQDPQDILYSYQNYANSYIVKPEDLDSFYRVVRHLETFWFSVAKLPTYRKART